MKPAFLLSKNWRLPTKYIQIHYKYTNFKYINITFFVVLNTKKQASGKKEK